jgi:hypothetical protein
MIRQNNRIDVHTYFVIEFSIGWATEHDGYKSYGLKTIPIRVFNERDNKNTI